VNLEIRIEEYGVCAACGCLKYAAIHYALINSKDSSRANELGFVQINPSE
jgi:hypothetical protein